MKPKFPLLLTASLAIVPITPVSAVDLWWSANTSNNWGTAANWSTSGTGHVTGTIPGANDTARFNINTLTADQLVQMASNQSVARMVFSSPGAVTIQGSGSARTLNIGGTIDIGAGAGAVVIGLPSGGSGNGIAVRIAEDQTWTNNSSNVFTIHNSIRSTATTGTQTITVDGTGDTVLGTTAGVGISSETGFIGITKKGTGTLTLHTGSGYKGVTRIEGGVLVASVLANGGADSSIGGSSSDASNLVFDGGTLHWTGAANVATNRGFTLEDGGGTIRNDNTGALVRFGGGITGVGSLTKTGAGTLALSAASDYSGKTFIQAGTISARTATALGSGTSATDGTEISSGATLLLDPGTTGGPDANTTWTEHLQINGGTLHNNSKNNTWEGLISLGATSDFSAAASTTLTVTSVVSGAGGLNKIESGIVHLRGANTYTGVTTLKAGVLRVDTIGDGGAASGIGASGSASSNLVFDGGTLFFSNSENVGTDRGFTLAAGGGTFRKDAAIARFSGVITGSGDLRKIGSGTLAFSNNTNDFTGRIVVDQGAVEARVANALGASGTAQNGVLVNANGTLNLAPNGTGGANENTTWNETITMNGGTLRNLHRSNTWTGGVILEALNSTLSADTGTSLRITSAVTESVAGSGLTKAGAGLVTFEGVNTYTGVTSVTAGVLVAATTGGFNSSTTVSATGGTFRLGAANVIGDNAIVSLGTGGVLQMNNFSDIVGVLQMTGDGTIDMNGTTGTLRLGDSAGEVWAGLLSISGWDGLVVGGGNERIIFGDDDAALTLTQLGQVRFINPTGLAEGSYDAKILTNGEIVPNVLVPEPSALLLAALGGLAFAGRRKR